MTFAVVDPVEVRRPATVGAELPAVSGLVGREYADRVHALAGDDL
ncbi:hypothetical protein [Streptomyces changanensis]